MVSVVTGSGLGLHRGVQGLVNGLGQWGAGVTGRGGERVQVNAASGNLVLQHRDEFLANGKVGAGVLRSYNSQGREVAGGNWRLGFARRVFGLTGAANTPGSEVWREGEDGAQVRYRYDASSGGYLGADEGGADDRLTLSADGTQWRWRD
ncbi:hypothetical protein, partial [Paludibacterium paludis]